MSVIVTTYKFKCTYINIFTIDFLYYVLGLYYSTDLCSGVLAGGGSNPPKAKNKIN